MAILKEGNLSLSQTNPEFKGPTNAILTTLATLECTETGKRIIRIDEKEIELEAMARELYGAFQNKMLIGILGENLKPRVLQVNVTKFVRQKLQQLRESAGIDDPTVIPEESENIFSMLHEISATLHESSQGQISLENFTFYVQLFGLQIPQGIDESQLLQDESLSVLARLYELHNRYPMGLYSRTNDIIFKDQTRKNPVQLFGEEIIVLGRCGSDEGITIPNPQLFFVHDDTSMPS